MRAHSLGVRSGSGDASPTTALRPVERWHQLAYRLEQIAWAFHIGSAERRVWESLAYGARRLGQRATRGQ